MGDIDAVRAEECEVGTPQDASELKMMLEQAVLEEREACAKAVELEAVNDKETGSNEDIIYNLALTHAAEAIRLRSK